MKKIQFKNSSQTETVGKIVCVGRNYAEHAEELGNEIPEFPLIFLKPASSLIFNGDNIIHPSYSDEMHNEVELVLLIGSDIKNADDESAENAIAAYTVGLDMTLRDIQSKSKSKGHPWTLAKCFDTSAVVSDFKLKSEYKLTGDEKIKLSVNGIQKQHASLFQMIFSPAELVKYISARMTLEKGDLIFTGTPAGVGKVNRGDILTAEIENIASLENKII
ncbi:MAG: fumarylacetoacetate hydrolase family protein [Ignavibacteriae bacterium]|nr:FAA hydrolase family protein [Ignavibacteriota bacterium]NOG96856.1 fumarylacetoacetate hydrolase family protein [Ignavibacteriota bacterium]